MVLVVLLLLFGSFLSFLLFDFLGFQESLGVRSQPGFSNFVFPDQELNLETWRFVTSLNFAELYVIGVTAVLDAVDVFFSSVVCLFLLVLVRLVSNPDVDSVVSIKDLNVVVVKIILHKSENFFNEHVSTTV
jgi:hypothetical protein